MKNTLEKCIFSPCSVCLTVANLQYKVSAMNNYILLAASMAFILTALHQVFTLPAGIKNILNEGMSRPLLLCLHGFGLAMYMGWCIYGILLKDIVIVFGCGMGVISSSILFGYTVWLRRRTESTVK